MPDRVRRLGIVVPLAIVAIAGAAAVAIHLHNETRDAPPRLLGVARETEIRISPERNGRLASIEVRAGQRVQKGDVLALLSSPELTAAVAESKAAGLQAKADRNNVFAGVRKEEVEQAGQNVRVAEANVTLARQQYTRAATLAEKDVVSKQKLDEATNSLRKAEAILAQLQAAYSQSQAGPTKEERANAEAKLALAVAKTADLEATLAKTRIVAPVDGVVGLIVATQGEVISPGQAILTLDVPQQRWFSFTVREDGLKGIGVGSDASVMTAAGKTMTGRVSELRPLGEFATWRAARAVGDHDLNSFFLRVDPTAPSGEIEPGMSVWLSPVGSDARP
jgi:HlyD family secretion protein